MTLGRRQQDGEGVLALRRGSPSGLIEETLLDPVSGPFFFDCGGVVGFGEILRICFFGHRVKGSRNEGSGLRAPKNPVAE